VRELHPRIFPISALRFPAAIHSTTSSSRFVNGRDSGSAGRFEPAFVVSPPWRPFRVDMGVAFNSPPRESRPYALGRTTFSFFQNGCYPQINADFADCGPELESEICVNRDRGNLRTNPFRTLRRRAIQVRQDGRSFCRPSRDLRQLEA
jgi:hypothetical protein